MSRSILEPNRSPLYTRYLRIKKIPVNLDSLFEIIVPEDSQYEILKTKVEIRLKKASIGTKWPTLLSESALSSTKRAGDYPTSSRSHHDWDKIAKDTDNDPELKPEGEQQLNELFQKIYRDANEETRRAMIKSYQESNGSSLSTNWEEVG